MCALDNILSYGYVCINNKITMHKSMNGRKKHNDALRAILEKIMEYIYINVLFLRNFITHSSLYIVKGKII